jgi:hypothetical protein
MKLFGRIEGKKKKKTHRQFRPTRRSRGYSVSRRKPSEHMTIGWSGKRGFVKQLKEEEERKKDQPQSWIPGYDRKEAKETHKTSPKSPLSSSEGNTPSLTLALSAIFLLTKEPNSRT